LSYTHGVYIKENSTSVVAPITTDSGVQFIVGTAPINLLDDPYSAAVNTPILVTSLAEAKTYFGYSDDFEKFSICQSVNASFNVYNVSPLVIVNVFDPNKHATPVLNKVYPIDKTKITVSEKGILLDSVVVKSEDAATTYAITTDYTLAFDDDGYVILTVVSGGTITSTSTSTKLAISYNYLDHTLVTKDDIIGSYDTVTGKYTGLQNIEQVYPKLGVVPGLIVAPGWSQVPAVGIAMMAKTEDINGCFKCMAVLDVDTDSTTGAYSYQAVLDWKNNNSYTSKNSIVCWPKVKIDEVQYWFSAVAAALIAYTDADNDDVPYVSPSNKRFSITGTVLKDGLELYLSQAQGNYLNGNGIVTAVNLNGWRLWGNNTGIYPSSTDVKDRFIPVRRMFSWWGNNFILTYFQKVDDPMNTRLIEAIVDSENIRANGYKARYQIADARIEYLADENPTTDLLNGKIRFHQYLTPFPPAETIIDTLEFDSDALTTALGGE
jgi:phage tail sheath protein FI